MCLTMCVICMYGANVCHIPSATCPYLPHACTCPYVKGTSPYGR